MSARPTNRRSAASSREVVFQFAHGDRTLRLGGGVTRVMGIVNVTPDSFHAASRTPDCAAAVRAGLEQIELGAAVVDVGGESTRPGAEPVGAVEERRRVIPVIERLAASCRVPISVDTYRAEVARAAVAAGAMLVNDVSGGLLDPEMPATVAGLGVPVILGHVSGRPASMRDVHSGHHVTADPVARAVRELAARIAVFEAAGVRRESLLVDPGIGFGKDAAENLAILRDLTAFAALDRPIVIGVSRKRFLGAVDGRDDGPEDRLVASVAAQVLAATRGAALIRTHDVRETVRSLAIVDAILH